MGKWIRDSEGRRRVHIEYVDGKECFWILDEQGRDRACVEFEGENLYVAAWSRVNRMLGSLWDMDKKEKKNGNDH